ncbi:hypothetical protein [Acaryochloris sp. CCMEE 5410]|uniref:hypothetical protein n=1 Tax=Acaryochloris sp. CCMEE 5410 TaxID=310037 RepID=UPI00024847AF|nr:hypothetical protein [Acaryochloris sp. CCMEE 5410]KAI9130619.1 hypothetical protein ON05_022835 [Acaryochloris sp. CCMEE 5410]
MDNLPIPESIQYADICRDGGSYLLAYTTANEGICELELRVRKNHNYDRIGYWPPTLWIGQSQNMLQLNWDDAEYFAARFSTLLHPDIGWGGTKRAKEMIAYLQAKGTLDTTQCKCDDG